MSSKECVVCFNDECKCRPVIRRDVAYLPPQRDDVEFQQMVQDLKNDMKEMVRLSHEFLGTTPCKAFEAQYE